MLIYLYKRGGHKLALNTQSYKDCMNLHAEGG